MCWSEFNLILISVKTLSVEIFTWSCEQNKRHWQKSFIGFIVTFFYSQTPWTDIWKTLCSWVPVDKGCRVMTKQNLSELDYTYHIEKLNKWSFLRCEIHFDFKFSTHFMEWWTDECEVNEMNRKGRSRQEENSVVYALQVSARSGPSHPSGFAGRPLGCAWAASGRRSRPPGDRCSPLKACRPPLPTGRAAHPILYLKQRKQRRNGDIKLNGGSGLLCQDSIWFFYSFP